MHVVVVFLWEIANNLITTNGHVFDCVLTFSISCHDAKSWCFVWRLESVRIWWERDGEGGCDCCSERVEVSEAREDRKRDGERRRAGVSRERRERGGEEKFVSYSEGHLLGFLINHVSILRKCRRRSKDSSNLATNISSHRSFIQKIQVWRTERVLRIRIKYWWSKNTMWFTRLKCYDFHFPTKKNSVIDDITDRKNGKYKSTTHNVKNVIF